MASITSTLINGNTDLSTAYRSFSVDRKTTVVIPGRWDKLYDYSFYVARANADDGRVGGTPAQGVYGMSFPSLTMTLALPPTSISISTSFAATATPTNRGILEEHNGVVFRTIMISGTTGVYPARDVADSSGGLISRNGGIAAFLPATSSALNGLVKNTASVFGASSNGKSKALTDAQAGDTGYARFWMLNNFLVAYAEAKKFQENQDIRLVFSCPKDNIAYVCTPVSFDLKRDASQPMLYRYQIVLRAWDVVTAKGSQPSGPSKGDGFSIRKVLSKIAQGRQTIQSASNVIRGVQSDAFDVMNGVNQIILGLKDVAGIENQLIDFLPTLSSNANLLITTNKAQWAQVISDRQEAVSRLNNLFTGNIQETAQNALSGVSTSQAQQSGTPMTSGESVNATSGVSPQATSLIGSILNDPTLSSSIDLSELQPLPPSVQKQIDDQKTQASNLTTSDVIRVASKLQEMSNNLAYAAGMMDPTYAKAFGLPAPAEFSLREPNEQDILLAAEIENTRQGLLSTLATGTLFQPAQPDPFQKANAVLPQDGQLKAPISASVYTVEKGLTLDQIAQRTLGDATRAQEIAILNDLKPPYIDEAGFTLPFTNPSDRTFLVTDKTNLAIGQTILLQANTVAVSRRRVLNLETLSDTSVRVTVDGLANLSLYTAAMQPYLWARLPGTVGSGDTLLIPSDQTATLATNSRTTPLLESLSYAEQVFGVDLAIGPDRDLVVQGGSDLGLAYGYTNGAQIIASILEVEQGELTLHPDFGLSSKIGNRITRDLTSEIEARVKGAILADSRFTSVQISVTQDGTAFYIQGQAQGIQGTGLIPIHYKIQL